MSSPAKSPSSTADAAPNGRAMFADDKLRLTEEEKKLNHIASGAFGKTPFPRCSPRSGEKKRLIADRSSPLQSRNADRPSERASID